MDESAADELVEWVDEAGETIEVVTRAQMRARNLRHRSVAIVVTASDGRLLVHQRSDAKDLFPGWWDIAAGGVAGVGETYEAAAARELAEELGIDAVLTWIGAGRYDDDHSREVCHVYYAVHDGPYQFTDGEIAAARLVTPTELQALRARERFLPGSLAMILPLVPGFGRVEGLRGDPGASPTMTAVHHVEFTIEPFVEGQPGEHVLAPIDAVHELGVEVEFGPFGSSCVTPAEQTPEVVAAIVRAALEHGATNVNIDIARVGDGEVTDADD